MSNKGLNSKINIGMLQLYLLAHRLSKPESLCARALCLYVCICIRVFVCNATTHDKNIPFT